MRALLGACAGGMLAQWPLQSHATGSRAQGLRVPLAVSDHVNRDFVLPLLALLARAAHWQWDLQFVPMARVLAMLERGECLGFGLGRTPAREATLSFSEPLFSSRVWPVSRRDRRLRIRRIEELRGLTVCLSRVMSYGAQIDAAKGREFRVEYADGDHRSRLRMLLAERCDVVLMTHRSADPWLLERRLREAGGMSALVEVGDTPLLSESVHIACAQGSPWVRHLPALDAALRGQQAAIRALVDSQL